MKKRDETEGNFGDEALREKLQQIAPREKDAPEALKKDVFSSLDAMQLLADITGLFTVQFTQAELEILDAIFSPEGSEEES